jgi:hypothetical protein
LVTLNLFRYCPPLFSVLTHSQFHVLQIFLNWLKPPTHCMPAGLRTVSFLQGSSSCILKRCPSLLKLPLFITTGKVIN